ncbi:hypothetical protein C9J01_19185 [Photobacterium rosenbergii]|uniref:DUF4760 domain-containing protein n=1 Tax=Photobacterium rosenbergii TaxID=294936 RepID=A0A2T3N9Y8_9GAMM|nr:hypothetical protein [Photobacterium rosenbergii]PSW10333.1 hypothetical protein C9J01_19185 [Photobacterium rosenbergii]
MRYIAKVMREASDSMFKVYVCIFIVVLALIRVTFSIYFLDKEPYLSEYFSGNLLPELTGMIIELLLFIFVIDFLRDTERAKQEQDKQFALHKEKVEIEHRLRAQLRVFVRRVFEDVKLGNGETGVDFKFHASEHTENQKTLKILKSMLAEELESSTFADNLIASADFELPLMHSLSSVTADLSGRHLKAWMNIVFYLKQVALKKNVKENTEKLIDWIAMFDKFSYQQKLVE